MMKTLLMQTKIVVESRMSVVKVILALYLNVDFPRVSSELYAE